MTARSYQRGYEVYYDEEKEEWLYSDDNSSVCIDRPCRKCGRKATGLGHDNCMQNLSNCTYIVSACCGHGNDENAYILLKDGRKFILDRR